MSTIPPSPRQPSVHVLDLVLQQVGTLFVFLATPFLKKHSHVKLFLASRPIRLGVRGQVRKNKHWGVNSSEYEETWLTENILLAIFHHCNIQGDKNNNKRTTLTLMKHYNTNITKQGKLFTACKMHFVAISLKMTNSTVKKRELQWKEKYWQYMLKQLVYSGTFTGTAVAASSWTSSSYFLDFLSPKLQRRQAASSLAELLPEYL